MIKLALKTVREVVTNGTKICTKTQNGVETSKFMLGNKFYITMRNIFDIDRHIYLYEVDKDFNIDIYSEG